MKEYTKPSTTQVVVGIEKYLLTGSNGIKSVDGVLGLSVSDDDFGGGSVDSRRSTVWDLYDE